jgi:hypothetical protein
LNVEVAIKLNEEGLRPSFVLNGNAAPPPPSNEIFRPSLKHERARGFLLAFSFLYFLPLFFPLIRGTNRLPFQSSF